MKLLCYYSLAYGEDTFLFISEYLSNHAETLLAGDSVAWFSSLAYYWDDFTPYITVGANKNKSVDSMQGVDTTGLTGQLFGMVSGLNTGLNAAVFNLRNQNQKSFTVGTRWDFRKNMALKVQFDRFFLDDNSTGIFINPTPEFERGTNINLFSAAVDFIF